MYRLLLIGLVLFASVHLTPAVRADPSQDVSAAVARHDYEGAMAILRKAATAGDVPAQFSLGSILYFGGWPSVQMDRAEGLRWLQAAANRNNLDAQLLLARQTRDHAEALGWYEKAAVNGSAEAQGRIGKAYWWGNGRPRDIKVSIQWFQKAAAGGNSDAQLLLGVQYAIGAVLPRDLTQSRYWFLKLAGSSALNATTAQNYLGTFYEKGLGGPQSYAEALRWYEEAAKDYAPYAEFELGAMHEFGRGVPVSLGKALELYRKAALKRYEPAQYRMGIAYLQGEGVPRDRAEALKWLAFAVGWNGIDDLARAQHEALPSQHESVRSTFELDPDLFRLLTGQLRPDAYDYAMATVRQLAKDPIIRARAMALGVAFQPTPPPPPIIFH